MTLFNILKTFQKSLTVIDMVVLHFWISINQVVFFDYVNFWKLFYFKDFLAVKDFIVVLHFLILINQAIIFDYVNFWKFFNFRNFSL